MNFAEPIVLWGLLGPALAAATLLVLGVLRGRRNWTRFPGITRVVAIGGWVHPVDVGRGSRRPWLLLLALTFALIALAGPRWGTIDEPVYQKSREVMIALDLSRSMLVQDVPPSRLDRSRLLVRSLLDGLRGERIGLIVFAGTAFVQVPMSSDYQILEEFLPELKPGYMPQGGSDYAGMLQAAINGFGTGSETDRYLIVLSDGEAQDDRWREQVPAIKSKGIQIIALGVGTTAGGFIPDPETGAYVKDTRGAVVLSRLEPATLQSLAVETAGTYRDASAWLDLAALLEETIERGRQGAFTETRAARAIERFQWFLAPALLFALLGVWREIPTRPRARQIRSDAARPAAPSSRSRAQAGSTTAVVLLAVALFPMDTARAAIEDTTSTPPIDRLRATITRLAAADTVSAAGWKAMAEQTLLLGQELLKAGQPVETGVVHDALAAVDAGERADVRAADWPALRENLQKLLQPPPEQKQDKQDQKQDNREEEKPRPSGGQNDQSDPQESEQDQQKQQSSPEEQQQSDEQQQSPSEQQQQPGPSEQQQQPGQSPPPPKTRKFGGQQDSRQGQPEVDPELAAALARLEQVTEKDSPAILHQRLEENARREKRQGTAPDNPHDW